MRARSFAGRRGGLVASFFLRFRRGEQECLGSQTLFSFLRGLHSSLYACICLLAGGGGTRRNCDIDASTLTYVYSLLVPVLCCVKSKVSSSFYSSLG